MSNESNDPEKKKEVSYKDKNNKKPKYLDKFGINLTDRAK